MSGTGGNGLTFVLVNIALIDLRDDILERIEGLEVLIEEVDRRLYAEPSTPVGLARVHTGPFNDVLWRTVGVMPTRTLSELTTNCASVTDDT